MEADRITDSVATNAKANSSEIGIPTIAVANFWGHGETVSMTSHGASVKNSRGKAMATSDGSPASRKRRAVTRMNDKDRAMQIKGKPRKKRP